MLGIQLVIVMSMLDANSVNMLVLVVIWLAIFLFSWFFVFRKVFFSALKRVKDPESEERKAFSELGSALIDEMYPKLMEKIDQDAPGLMKKAVAKVDMGEIIDSAVDHIPIDKVIDKAMERFDFEEVIEKALGQIDIDSWIEKGKVRMREEAGGFVSKLFEPPVEITGPDGVVSVQYNEETKWMYNLMSQAVSYTLRMIPDILKKDEQGQWVVPDEVKMMSEWSEDYMLKRFTLILNKLQGSVGGLMEKLPGEMLNNPELITSLTDGSLQNIDIEQFTPLIGEKDAGKLGAVVKLAPTILKLAQVFKGLTAKAPGALQSSGAIRNTGIQGF